MTPTEAVTFFHSQSGLARVLGVTSQAVNKWVAQGEIPVGRQFQLQVLTRGKLRADGPNRPRTPVKNNYSNPKKTGVRVIDNRDQM
jgi:DNA-binding transcriptional regulator Cro